jgi:hypothetical protein
MAIETPSSTPIGSRTHSDFLLCQGFVFRLSTVDGFLYQSFPEGQPGVTTVNFKSYTQNVPDPERRLFDFLVSKLNPKPVP